MDRTLNGLLYSRKFYLAVFGVVQTIVVHYLSIPADIWQAIDALVIVLIGTIAAEDIAAARANAPAQTPIIVNTAAQPVTGTTTTTEVAKTVIAK